MDMNTNPKRIDVHHHILPPNFVSALNGLNIPWTGGPEVPSWSLQQAHDTMGEMGIDAAVASPSPGVYWGGDTGFAVKLARETNEFVAGVVRDDPEHFGAFATMPLPDVDAALDELEYAYDTLGFDGVVLYSARATAIWVTRRSTRSSRSSSGARRSCSSTRRRSRPAPTRRA